MEDFLDWQRSQVDSLCFKDGFKFLHLVELSERDEVVHKDVNDVIEDQRRAEVFQLLPAQPRSLQ